jgi:hypothetical protein
MPGYHHLVLPGQTRLRPYVERMRGGGVRFTGKTETVSLTD